MVDSDDDSDWSQMDDRFMREVSQDSSLVVAEPSLVDLINMGLGTEGKYWFNVVIVRTTKTTNPPVIIS